MGSKDIIEKEYLSGNREFADVANAYLFGGEQMIHPEDLKEQDTTEAYTELIGSDLLAEQRFRDVVKLLSIKGYQDGYLAIIGIENQTALHYALAVRNMLDDALNYASQVKTIGKANQDHLIRKGEFTSGFRKDDRILPVITIVVYWGPGKWDAPKSLYEMFPEDIPDDIKRFVPDYRINVLVPDDISDMGIFKTDVRKVMKAVRVEDDKEQLKELLLNDPDYQSVDRDAAIAINRFTGMNIEIPSGKEVNVCKAVKEMQEDWLQQGDKMSEGKWRLATLDDMLRKGTITAEAAIKQAHEYGFKDISSAEDLHNKAVSEQNKRHETVTA